jgi:hypothetical protein
MLHLDQAIPSAVLSPFSSTHARLKTDALAWDLWIVFGLSQT